MAAGAAAEPGGCGASLRSVQAAYSQWLQDEVATITDSSNARRRGGSKRHASRRLAALRHLTQPTVSSASKAGPADSSKAGAGGGEATADAETAQRDAAQRRRFRLLADEVSYAHVRYDPQRAWLPGLGFFQFLATRAAAGAAAVDGRGDLRGGPRRQRAEYRGFPVRVPPMALRLPQRGGTVAIAVLFTTEQEPPPPPQAREPTATAAAAATITKDAELVLQIHFFTTRELFVGRIPWILRMLLTPSESLVASASTASSTTTTPLPLAVRKTSHDDDGIDVVNGPPRNALEALMTPEAIEAALVRLWDDPSRDLEAVQAFVPCKGLTAAATTTTLRPWIARAEYRKRERGASTVWILTGDASTSSSPSSAFWASTAIASNGTYDWARGPPCQVVKCTTLQSWPGPRLVAATTAEYLELQLRVGLSELVVDLLQDPTGQWWLLQVKSFQLRQPALAPALLPGHGGAGGALSTTTLRAASAPDRLEPVTAVSAATTATAAAAAAAVLGQGPAGVKLARLGRRHVRWKCAGAPCKKTNTTRSDNNRRVHDDDDDDAPEDTDNPNDKATSSEPAAFVTKKELLSCDFYDDYRRGLSGGCGDLAGALAFHLQHQVSKRDRTVLYEPQPLCTACHRRYHRLRELCNAELAATATRGPEVAPKLRRRLPTSKSLQALGGPRPLPELRRSPRELTPLVTSESAPVLTTTSPRVRDALQSPHATPSYLRELDDIERLLAGPQEQDHDVDKATTTAAASPARDQRRLPHDDPLDAPMSPTPSWLRGATSARRDVGERVEAMWESLLLRPLAPRDTASSSSAAAATTTTTAAFATASKAYNTFSLSSALAELQQCDAAAQASTTASHAQQHAPSGRPTHSVTISSPPRIFADESYREVLVQEAVAHYAPRTGALLRFVVVGDEPQAEEADDDARALVRMALQTLYLDLVHALEAAGDGVVDRLPSVPPPVTDLGGGCAIMDVAIPAQSIASRDDEQTRTRISIACDESVGPSWQ